MGAEGVWTGSIWLTVAESDTVPPLKEKMLKAASRDTVRSRAMTGKPARLLRTPWTDAWDDEHNPKPLQMPLQFMATADAVSRVHKYAHVQESGAKDLIWSPVGQIVGRMNEERPTKDVIYDMVNEFLDATNRLQDILAAAEKE